MTDADALSPAENHPTVRWVADLMAAYPHPWWVCGGWAVDLHHGRTTRVHGDIDIAVEARHSADLAPVLAGQAMTRIHFPTDERFPWHGESLRPGPDGLGIDDAPFPVEILGVLIEDGDWVFPRGSHRIRRPVGAAFRTTPGGIPYQSPEIVLLYKARQLAEKDHADFRSLLPTLDDEQRTWLATAVPGDHPWAADL